MDVEIAVTLVVVGACLLIAGIAGLVELVRLKRERWLIVSAQITEVKRHRAEDVADSGCPDPSESATPTP